MTANPGRDRAPSGLGGCRIVGAAVLLLVAVALLAILVARSWTDRFLSVYSPDYITFAGVSLLQGLLCRWWWERG